MLEKDASNPRKNKVPLGSHVVHSLLSPCIEDFNPHVVFFEYFFTSLGLLTQLASLGIRATGTIRSNHTKNVQLMSDKEDATARVATHLSSHTLYQHIINPCYYYEDSRPRPRPKPYPVASTSRLDNVGHLPAQRESQRRCQHTGC